MTRPWVTPEEVREYTDVQAVKDRSDEKLAVDIFRAEQYAIQYTQNDFSDVASMPEAVINAVVILAEAYARQAVLSASAASSGIRTGGMKSETFDDYSYTLQESSADAYAFTAAGLGVDVLLDPYVIKKARGTVTFRMRKL